MLRTLILNIISRTSRRLKPARFAAPFLMFSGFAHAGPQFTLNARETVRLALAASTDVRMAVLDKEIAAAELSASELDFDTLFTVSPSYKFDFNLSNSTLESRTYKNTTAAFSLGLKRKLHPGTQVELSVQEMRLTSTALQSTYTERVQAAAQVKLTQPLLKGAGLAANTAQARKARLKLERYLQELEDARRDAAVKALTAYWDYRTALSTAALKEDDVHFFATKNEKAQAELKLGLRSEADALGVMAQYEVAKAQWLLAQNDVMESRDKLARQIVPLGAPLSDDLPIAVEDREDPFPSWRSRQAISSHPKVRIQSLRAQETSADLAKAKNALLPQLDLSAQYATVGAGEERSEAEKGLSSLGYPAWKIMLKLTIPFGNNRAEGERARLRAQVQTEEFAAKAKELALTREMATLERNLDQQRQTLASATRRVPMAKAIFDSKEKLFAEGMADFLELTEARNDYSNALDEVARAEADVAKGEAKRHALNGEMQLP